MHEKDRHPERYVTIGNHLAQHRELSLTAIGLSAHIQSLPTGADVSIKALARRFSEGETRIAAALRELEAHGYLSRTRERLPSGQVVTRTVSYNNPPAARLRKAEAALGRGPGRESAPSASPSTPPPPPGPVPALAAVAAAPPAAGPAAVPAPDAEPEAEPEPAPPAAHPRARSGPRPAFGPVPAEHREGAELLVRLRLRDPRLLLSERDVARLAPAVTVWLERGVTPAAVSGTLAGCLPAEPIRSPAGLLAHRLAELRPPHLARHAPGPRHPDRVVQPFQTCDGCDRAFRGASPGHCPGCTASAAQTAEAAQAAESARAAESAGADAAFPAPTAAA
ncbi:helix-turn-helix domain-containing protein [Streptomyces sp. NPDC002044]|uniref:helix-turn-helix domain-containing protein n=1 Tax=Streptomyces sp. NPDC002044 TaxID=3154662 RepID=UPI003324D41D